MPNQEQAKEAKKNGSACASFCTEGPLAAATQPVAGPMVIKLLYNLLLFAVFIFFIVCLAEAAPTWRTPIVEVKAKFMKELEYPDMYFCIPPLGMSSIIQDKIHFGIMGLAKPKADVPPQKVCRGFSEMTRIRVSLTMDQDYVDCQSTVGISDERAISYGYIFTNEKTPSDMGLQFDIVEATKIEGGSPFKVNEVAANLASSLGTFKDPEDADAEEYSAFCFSYTDNNVTAKYDSNNVLMNVNTLKLNAATTSDLLYMNAYFVPKGELPYKKVGNKYVATATSVLWPLKNSLTQAQLTTEVITDTSRANARLPEEDRVYSSTPLTQYKVSVNGQPTRLSVYDQSVANNQLQFADTRVYGANSVRFGSFVQQNILIRDKTTAEVWAEVGGLWAGAALIITVFFKNSGYTTRGVPEDAEDRDGKPLMVARFLPGSVTKNHLAAYTKSNQAKQEAAEKSASTVADAEKPASNDV